MKRALVAGAVYFAMLFALGFVVGTFRVMLVAPRLGEIAATALELPVMLAASWIVCGRTIRLWRVPAAAASRALMGVWAFVLLMAGETLLGVFGFGRTLAEQWAAVSSPSGLMGLAAQLGFALFPLLHRETCKKMTDRGSPGRGKRARWQLSRRKILLGLGASAMAGGGYTGTRYSVSIRAAEQRVSGRSSVIPTRFGDLEYAVSGAGPPLMMIHGTGGGFDQGLHFAAGFMNRGHQIIAPSRFGYLRSDFPTDPSSQNQADALVELLDHLRIDRLPVAGGSAGALSAAQFALRHPDRCSGLVLLVPAANVRGRDPVAMSPLRQTIVKGLLTSDFLYWTTMTAAPEQLIGTLLATDPRLLDQVSARERRRAHAILEDMMPIHARTRGVLNDGQLAGSPARMDFNQIGMPTLIISMEDDRFGTAATARDIAAAVPRSTLKIYPSGGHIWLGHDDEVADEVHRFLIALPSSG